MLVHKCAAIATCREFVIGEFLFCVWTVSDVDFWIPKVLRCSIFKCLCLNYAVLLVWTIRRKISEVASAVLCAMTVQKTVYTFWHQCCVFFLFFGCYAFACATATIDSLAQASSLRVRSWLHPFTGHCEQKAMRDEGVIYIAGHPLLNRRCTRLPGCFYSRKRKL